MANLAVSRVMAAASARSHSAAHGRRRRLVCKLLGTISASSVPDLVSFTTARFRARAQEVVHRENPPASTSWLPCLVVSEFSSADFLRSDQGCIYDREPAQTLAQNYTRGFNVFTCGHASG